MKNVKFRGKKTNSAGNSAAQIPWQKPKFREIPRAAENCGPYTSLCYYMYSYMLAYS